jgi:hypothetical protein
MPAAQNEKDLEHVELQSSSSSTSHSTSSAPELSLGGGGHLRTKSEDLQSPLPSPVQAQPPRPPKPALSPAAIIPVWIALSSAVIIYNNYVYNTLNFKYPVFIVTWHLTFAVRLSVFWAFRIC